MNFPLCISNVLKIAKTIMATGLRLGVNVCGRLVLPLPIPQWCWTSTWLFSSPWTASSSDKTICVADHPNSEFWQRIGQPYVRKSGRCFVAAVDIEADRCAVCLAELDVVQSEADIQANVRCPTLFWSGRRAGNKQSPDNAASQIQLFRLSFITYLC